MPVLYIITGSNGAGKSSVGPDYIPSHLRDSLFDGDKLFMQKRSEFWVNGIKSHKECKKLAAEYVEKNLTPWWRHPYKATLILLMRDILPMMQHGAFPNGLKMLDTKYI